MLMGTNSKIKSALVNQMISNLYPSVTTFRGQGGDNKQDTGIESRLIAGENKRGRKQERAEIMENSFWKRGTLVLH